MELFKIANDIMTGKHVDSECVVLYIYTVWGLSNSRMAIIGSE